MLQDEEMNIHAWLQTQRNYYRRHRVDTCILRKGALGLQWRRSAGTDYTNRTGGYRWER